MNSVIEQSLQQISFALNSELNLEADHAWLIPAQAPELILTLLWPDEESHELTLSLALGTFNERAHNQLAVDMLSANLGLAVQRGPKLSYSPGSGLLIMLDTVPCHHTQIVGLGEVVNLFVTYGNEVRDRFCQQGYNLQITDAVV